MSRAELAAKTGIANARLTKILDDHVAPNVNEFAALCAVTGIADTPLHVDDARSGASATIVDVRTILANMAATLTALSSKINDMANAQADDRLISAQILTSLSTPRSHGSCKTSIQKSVIKQVGLLDAEGFKQFHANKASAS